MHLVFRNPTVINQQDVSYKSLFPASQFDPTFPAGVLLYVILCQGSAGISVCLNLGFNWSGSWRSQWVDPGCCVSVCCCKREWVRLFSRQVALNCSATVQILTVALHLFTSFCSPRLSQISLDACAWYSWVKLYSPQKQFACTFTYHPLISFPWIKVLFSKEGPLYRKVSSIY